MLELAKLLNTGMLDVGYSVRSGVRADLLLQAPHCLADYRYLCHETILKNYAFFLVYMYYTHLGYQLLINCIIRTPAVASWRCSRVSACNREVVGSSLGRALRRKNSGQVSHTHVPLPPSSITWYRRKLGSKQTRRAIH